MVPFNPSEGGKKMSSTRLPPCRSFSDSTPARAENVLSPLEQFSLHVTTELSSSAMLQSCTRSRGAPW